MDRNLSNEVLAYIRERAAMFGRREQRASANRDYRCAEEAKTLRIELEGVLVVFAPEAQPQAEPIASAPAEPSACPLAATCTDL